jgi:hypothetical protein
VADHEGVDMTEASKTLRLDLEVNLRRCGLSAALADQVRAEVKDSIWLALQIDAAERRGAAKALRDFAPALLGTQAWLDIHARATGIENGADL